MVAQAQNLVLGEFQWILVVGSFAAFLFGFGTGSNDVANAFGTSVGAKTLSLKSAVLIAIIFEFTGALVLGRVSQETIAGGIADIGAFTTEPEFYAYGMMWALIVGGVWQILASYMELNVSATHSIIGAIVGFAMVFKGRGAVVWAQEQIVCTGPLTGYNLGDSRPSGSVLYFNNVPLAGTYTVPISALYNSSTGASLSTMSAALLSSWTGFSVLPNNAATWATPAAVAACATQCYQTSSAGAPKKFSANSGPYIINMTGYPFGAVQFALKTAGHEMPCSGAGCPIKPAASMPIRPGQYYYSSAVGYCTTASNAKLPFPPYKGVLIIVLSWFFSPVLTGIASAIVFSLSRALVLRHVNSYRRSFLVLPPMAFLTFWVNIYFVFTKGAAKVLSSQADGWTDTRAAWIAAAAAGGVSFFSALVIIPLLHHRIETVYQKRDEEQLAVEAAELQASADVENGAPAAEGEKGTAAVEGDALDTVAAPPAGNKRLAQLRDMLQKARDAAMHGVEVDIHNIVEEDELVAAIHANAEVFDEKAETVFSYMQVFSAICVIFAHGAGEVGYMSGPLGAIFSIIRSGSLSDKTSPPIWTVLVGAFGLIIGLGTYGYSVTRAIGTRMAKLTPSRGFAAELSTSMIIMIAAQYGLPTSSSQCITGGIIGIALCEGKGGLNLKFILQTFASWIWTVVFMALITGFFFAQGAFAPSVQMARTIGYYEESLAVRSNLILNNYQSMIKQSGYVVDKSNKDLFATYLQQTIDNTAAGQYYSYNKAPDGFYPGNVAPKIQTVPPWQMVGYLDTALALVQMSVKPDVDAGVNMCKSASDGSSTNWATSPNSFPWSAKALASAGAAPSTAALAGSRGPCGLNATAQPTSIQLTKAVFLGPTPAAPFGNFFKDRNNNAFAGTQFNGTVERLFSNTYGDVTLDQVANFRTCQQAPCNQAWYYTWYYMG